MIPKIYKDHTAVISSTMDPATESYFSVELFAGYNPTGVRAHADLKEQNSLL
jgi:hypothetical protein